MKDDRDTSPAARETGSGSGVVRCDDIQSLLLAYLSRELGEARSDLVREHLRKCRDCQARAAEIQETVRLLQDVSPAHAGLPERLSERHHARLIRAVTHPVLDWIYVHHILVSILVTLAALLFVFAGLWRYRIWRTDRAKTGIEVRIGKGKPAPEPREEPRRLTDSEPQSLGGAGPQ